MTSFSAFKSGLRQKLESHALLSYFTALAHSKALGILALRYRLLAIGRFHIASTAKVTGWSGCEFGQNSSIGARTWINVNHRKARHFSVVIGKNTFIGQDNFLTAGHSVIFGDYCLTAAHCAFISSTHHTECPDRPYATTGTTGTDSIIIGTNCFIGYGATVLGNVTIGHGCIIGAKSLVTKDIPPFSLAVGSPAKVIKHFDFSANSWVNGPRPQDKVAEVPSEGSYKLQLSSQQKFQLQPVSAASAWLSDI